MKGRHRLYVVEELNRETGDWQPEIWSCRPTRAWARDTKRKADEGTSPKNFTKRRICLYRPVSVVR